MKNYTKKLDPKDIANMEDITGGSTIAFDDKTIVEADGKRQTAIGGWLEPGELVFNGEGDSSGSANKITLSSSLQKTLTTGYTIRARVTAVDKYVEGLYGVMQGTDELYLLLDGDLERHKVILGDGTIGTEVVFENTDGILPTGHYQVILGSDSDIYHPIDNRFLKLEPNSLKVNNKGELEVIEHGSSEPDGKTIIKNDDEKLETAIGGWKEESGQFSYNSQATSDGTSSLITMEASLSPDPISAGDTIAVQLVGPKSTELEKEYTVEESHAELSITLDGMFENYSVVLGDGSVGSLVQLKCMAGNIPEGSYVLSLAGGEVIYHTIDSNFVSLDEDTLGINEDGEIYCKVESASYTGGDGITIYDNNTITTNFGGDLHYTDVETKWENSNFMRFYDDVYGVDGGPTGDVFVNDNNYRLKATIFGDTIDQVFKATNLEIQIQGSSYSTIGISIGKISGLDSYIINYSYGGETQPALAVVNCTTEIPFTSEDISSLTGVEEHIKYINNKVLDINTEGLEIDANERLKVKPYTAGTGIDITNKVISSKVTFTYDSATGTLAIVNEAE